MKHVKLFEEFVQSNRSKEVNEANILGSLIATVLAYGINVFIDAVWPTLERAWKLISPQKHHRVIRALGKDKAFNKEMFEVITSTGKYKDKLYFNRFVLRDVIAEVPAFKAVVQKFGAEEDAPKIAKQIADVIVDNRSWIKDRLAEVQNEAFDTGKVLMGDPDGAKTTYKYSQDQWKRLGVPFEPNTMDEKQLIDLLREWIKGESRNPELGKLLKELMPLKKKFPQILDPIKGRDVYDGTFFYRGTLVPMKDMLALKGWFVNGDVSFYEGAIECKAPYVWNSINTKGFTSLTPSPETAQEFALAYMQEAGMDYNTTLIDRIQEGSGMIPVLVKIEDTHKDVIMNPNFLNTVGGLMEYETFLIGNKTKAYSMIIPYWDRIELIAQQIDVDLSQYFKMK